VRRSYDTHPLRDRLETETGRERMRTFRWWVFKKISRFGWWVCPEPQRSELYRSMFFDPNWKDGLPRPHPQEDKP
jgi:hypothetical protein